MAKKKAQPTQSQSKEVKMAIVEGNESNGTIEAIVNNAVAEATSDKVIIAEPIIEEQPTVIETPVVEVPPVVEKQIVKPIEKKADTEVSLSVRIEIIKATGSAREKYVIESIENYMDKMSPGKPVSNDEGAKQQYNLWKLISNIIESSSNEEFNKLWNILLAYFKEYEKGVFADRYVFRFSEYWIWSTKDLTALQRILNLIKNTCDNNKRSVNIGKVDINRTLESGFSEEGRTRVISFYKR